MNMRRRIVCISAILIICSAAAASLCLCENFKYESRGKRDPFVPLLGADKSLSTNLENITSLEDLKLEGIATGASGKNIAIINGEIVKEKDSFGELRIKKITKNSVTVSISGIEYNLNIQEEEGVKSGK